MLGHYRRVLVIGAHPDDEDTELLTVLVRGMGAEAAYLSLNRGEGGQNLIGPELGEALGLIRTEELLAARRLDGARQYFTRAYDFGFSKTLDETWAQWPRDTILKDVVRIVRRFRPQVLVSIFRGNPRDGHGQHQAAGWVTREAFEVAGDSTRFPELLREEGLQPWTPLKLYRSARFDTAATTLVLDGGALDPAVGKSYHQIAMAGRSLHRSQDMGQLQTIGPSPVRLALLQERGAGRQHRGPVRRDRHHPRCPAPARGWQELQRPRRPPSVRRPGGQRPGAVASGRAPRRRRGAPPRRAGPLSRGRRRARPPAVQHDRAERSAPPPRAVPGPGLGAGARCRGRRRPGAAGSAGGGGGEPLERRQRYPAGGRRCGPLRAVARAGRAAARDDPSSRARSSGPRSRSCPTARRRSPRPTSCAGPGRGACTTGRSRPRWSGASRSAPRSRWRARCVSTPAATSRVR